MRKAFLSQDQGGCESLSLTRMFPTLLRKYRTRRRCIIDHRRPPPPPAAGGRRRRCRFC